MTEKLRDVLRAEAGEARVPPTDLGPVLSAGDRVVRRRRMIGSGAVAAVAALALMVAPRVVDRVSDPGVVASGPESPPEVWADGDSLHFGDVEVSLREGLDELTYLDGDDYVAYNVSAVSGPGWDTYVMRPSGDVTKVRSGPYTPLTSDGESRIAWIDRTDGGADEVVIRSVSGETERVRIGRDLRNPYLVAMDEGVVYFAAENRARVWSVSPGSEPTPTAWEPNQLLDVRDGVAAMYDFDDEQQMSGAVVFEDSRGDEVSRVDGLPADQGRLSGGGAEDAVFLSDAEDGPVLVDVSSGEVNPIEIEDFEVEHAGFVDAQLMLVVTRPEGDGWLTRVLTCTTAGASCDVVDEQPVGGQEYHVADETVLSSRLTY